MQFSLCAKKIETSIYLAQIFVHIRLGLVYYIKISVGFTSAIVLKIDGHLNPFLDLSIKYCLESIIFP